MKDKKTVYPKHEPIHAKPVCRWDRIDGYWFSGCGEEWSFSGHYGPVDNHMSFCMFCGRPLEEGE